MLLDALFRSKSLENPSTPITGDAVDTDGLFRQTFMSVLSNCDELAAVYSCIYVLVFQPCPDAVACYAQAQGEG